MISISNKNHWLKEQAELIPNRIAVFHSDFKITYRELLNESEILYRTLKSQGIRKNDRVLIVSNHNRDFFSNVNALWFLGAIPVPISAKLTLRELNEIIIRSSSKFIIDTKNIYYLENFHDLTTVNTNNTLKDIRFEETVPVKYNSSRICLMIHTSGSSGYPKIVQFSYDNLFESVISADSYINQTVYDKWLVSLPLNHIGGFSILCRSLISGCAIVFPDSLKHDYLMKSIKLFKPSLISFIPSMMDKLLIDFKVPWKGLRHIFLGGSPVPKILVEKALMKYWPINVVYGSTETASMITVCSMKNLEQHGVSAGIPLEGVKLRIEKQSNRLLTYGRIVIESKSVAVSYFNVNNKIEKDLGGGIYRSMDLGRIDKNGNLYISGRMDDIIISGGENISLPEIENLLNENKELANCKTIGINDNKWGQSYIIITDNEKKDIAKKIKDFLTERVAKFKLPHEVVIVDKIPVNELGKLNKNELKKTLKFDFL